MVGFPTETYQEASDTAELACRSNLHRTLFLLVMPFVGTELAEMAADTLKNKNDTIDPHYMNYYNNYVNISAMSDNELHSVFRRAYRSFYLNPKRILRLAIYHPNLFSLPYYAFSIMIRTLPRRLHAD